MPAKKKKHHQREPEQSVDRWEQLPLRTRHLLCLGFLFVLPFILYFSSTLGGQQYMGHDVLQWRAGAESLIEHREAFGEVAHWASNMFSGMPAGTISHPPQIWNLDNTLLRVLSFIYPAAEYWILLGGAYLMFILMGTRPLTAVLGAIIVGFSTYIPIIIGAGHNAKFISYLYIPWLFSGYFLLTRSHINRWLVFFVFTLALTLHLRAYHPQVTYFFLFPLGALFIVDGIKALLSQKTGPFLAHTGWLAAAAIVAVLISVQLYWSTAEYSPYSMRGGSEAAATSALSQDYAFAWSQGWGELLTLVIPGSYGGASGDAYWGPKTFTSGPHYMGALTLLFLVIGLFKSRRSLKWVFAGSGLATLLFSTGENFLLLNSPMFHYFPLFDKFRVPEMWLMVTVFCFAVVAVLGCEWILDQIKEEKRGANHWKNPLFISAGVGVVFILIGFQALSFEKPGERVQLAQQIAIQNNLSPDNPQVRQTVDQYIQRELVPTREEMARGDTLRFGLFFILGIGLLWLAGNQNLSPSTGFGVIVLLMAIDLIQVDKRYLSEQALVDGNLTREQVIEQTERPIDTFLRENVTSEERWPYRVLPLLDNPFNNAMPAYFYPSAGGYSGAKPGHYQDLIDEAFFSGPYGINTGVLNMLNIKYLTVQTPVDIPDFETVYQDQQGVVIENLNVLPKAFFVDSVAVLDDQPAVLREISGEFDPASVALLAEELSYPVQPDTTSSVEITEYNANRITLNLSGETPGFLVLSEIWYPPGWTATLNGEETEIMRTNYVLRGFEIPAGEHRLELVLEPVWYATGNWLARIGTFLLLGTGLLGVVLETKKRKK